MTPRLAKEIRPLVLPFVLSTSVMLLSAVLQYLSGGSQAYALLWRHSYGNDLAIFLPIAGWVIGCALLGVCGFNVENQDNTLLMLLSQPVSRGRIWWDKFKVLLPAVVGLTLIFAGVYQPAWSQPTDPSRIYVLGAVSVLASLSSAPFWTGLARSAVGAVVFNLTAQYLAMVVVLTVAEMLHLTKSTTLLVVGGCAYSLAFLAAGWIRFGRAEASDVRSHTPARSAPAGSRATAFATITPRCQPRGIWLNLIRRELVLQKPCFVLAGVLIATVPVLYLLDLTVTQRDFVALIQVLHLFPFAICLLGVTALAAPSAFCEEKSLGTQVWSLTQPVSARAQFFVKLGVASLVLLVLGVLLPSGLFFAYYTSLPGAFADTSINPGNAFTIALLVAVPVFPLSVRIATLVATPIQAVLTTIGVGLIAVSCCLMVFSWSSMPPVMYSSTMPVRLAGVGLDRASPLWTLASGWTPLGSYLRLVCWAFTALLTCHFLQGALANFRHPVSGARISRQLAWCAVLPVLVMACFIGEIGLHRRALSTQFNTLVQFQTRLERAITTLIVPPYRMIRPVEDYTFTIDELKNTRLMSDEDLARFSGGNQRILVRFMVRADHGPWVMVRFEPAIEFAENPEPSYREIQDFDFRYRQSGPILIVPMGN